MKKGKRSNLLNRFCALALVLAIILTSSGMSTLAEDGAQTTQESTVNTLDESAANEILEAVPQAEELAETAQPAEEPQEAVQLEQPAETPEGGGRTSRENLK